MAVVSVPNKVVTSLRRAQWCGGRSVQRGSGFEFDLQARVCFGLGGRAAGGGVQFPCVVCAVRFVWRVKFGGVRCERLHECLLFLSCLGVLWWQMLDVAKVTQNV